MNPDRDACYRAIRSKDPRFDGQFYTGVRTTGVYCRPICPAPSPKLENCVFLPSAAAAHEAGFRPCLRCRPELAPGIAGWRGTVTTVVRALNTIVERGVDAAGVEGLAARLGVTGRHLRRLFDQHLGASPIAVVQAHRILFAKKLITETAMSMTEIAFAAGFGSIRRFNDVMRQTYDRSPRELRRSPGAIRANRASGIVLKLQFIPPYDWSTLVAFLAPHAIPGVEWIHADCYRRTVTLDDVRGVVEVRPAVGQNYLLATIRTSNLTALPGIVGRLRQFFDLDADIRTIEDHLAHDPRLAPCVRIHSGLRVPGAWDPFEMAIRAILGHRVSVAAATRLAGRLVATHGEPITADQDLGFIPGLRSLFPRPEALAKADLTAIGLPPARARAISTLAAAVAADRDLLRPFDSLKVTIERLSRLPGIGEWTAPYIAMRAFHEPDAFPARDLGLLRALEGETQRQPTPAQLLHVAEAWRPWRAYAAVHLWLKDRPPAIAAATTSADASRRRARTGAGGAGGASKARRSRGDRASRQPRAIPFDLEIDPIDRPRADLLTASRRLVERG